MASRRSSQLQFWIVIVTVQQWLKLERCKSSDSATLFPLFTTSTVDLCLTSFFNPKFLKVFVSIYPWCLWKLLLYQPGAYMVPFMFYLTYFLAFFQISYPWSFNVCRNKTCLIHLQWFVIFKERESFKHECYESIFERRGTGKLMHLSGHKLSLCNSANYRQLCSFFLNSKKPRIQWPKSKQIP